MASKKTAKTETAETIKNLEKIVVPDYPETKVESTEKVSDKTVAEAAVEAEEETAQKRKAAAAKISEASENLEKIVLPDYSEGVQATVTETKETKVTETAEKKSKKKAAADSVKSGAKKAASATKKTTAKAAKTVKAAAEKGTSEAAKATKKTAAKIRKPEISTYVQFMGMEVNAEDLARKAEVEFHEQHEDVVAKKLDLYVKPEDHAAYYVVNGEYTGKIGF